MSELSKHSDALERALNVAARVISKQQEEIMREHPNAEELVAYQENRLIKATARRIRWHLMVCEECTQHLLALEALDFGQVEPELIPNPDETAADWDAFQQRLAEEGPQASTTDRNSHWNSVNDSVNTAGRKARHFLTLAATITILIGLGYSISDIFQRRVITPLSYSKPFLSDLLPDGTVSVRDTSPEQQVTVPDGMDSVILRLNLGDQKPYISYRAEILDIAGELRWQQDELQRQPAGQFIVWVGCVEVPEGSYKLRIIGIGSTETEILATYSFRLEEAGELGDGRNKFGR